LKENEFTFHNIVNGYKRNDGYMFRLKTHGRTIGRTSETQEERDGTERHRVNE